MEKLFKEKIYGKLNCYERITVKIHKKLFAKVCNFYRNIIVDSIL